MLKRMLEEGRNYWTYQKKHPVLGQAATLQCGRASRKLFLGTEDGSSEEVEGAEYNIRPGLLAESRGTREKRVCIPLGILIYRNHKGVC
jgi:hypothetical protein